MQRNTKNVTFNAPKQGEKNPFPVPCRLDHLRLLTLEGHNYNNKILARVLTIANYMLYCSDGIEWLIKQKSRLPFFVPSNLCGLCTCQMNLNSILVKLIAPTCYS